MGLCVTKLGIEVPALVDAIDDRVERPYTAWPDRLYVIDRNGFVAYKSAAGPWVQARTSAETLERILADRARIPRKPNKAQGDTMSSWPG